MSKFVSTKTGVIMSLLARQVLAVRLQERSACQCPAHGALIAIRLEHALLQDSTQEARHTRLLARSLKARPPGYVLLQGDGNVSQSRFHGTNIVVHLFRVNSATIGGRRGKWSTR